MLGVPLLHGHFTHAQYVYSEFVNAILCIGRVQNHSRRRDFLESSSRQAYEYTFYAVQRIAFTYLCIPVNVLLIACHCMHYFFIHYIKTNLTRFVGMLWRWCESKKNYNNTISDFDVRFQSFLPFSSFFFKVTFVVILVFTHTMRYEYALNYKA